MYDLRKESFGLREQVITYLSKKEAQRRISLDYNGYPPELKVDFLTVEGLDRKCADNEVHILVILDWSCESFGENEEDPPPGDESEHGSTAKLKFHCFSDVSIVEEELDSDSDWETDESDELEWGGTDDDSDTDESSLSLIRSP